MSYQEKRAVVSLLSTLLIFAAYWMFVLQKYSEASLSPTNVFSFWAAVILILIPVTILLKIILHIVFSIINTIATQEVEPSITDELDNLIELKAIRNSYYVFMLGFLLAMGMLVANLPPAAMFITLIFSLIVGLMMFDLSQLYFYRRGV